MVNGHFQKQSENRDALLTVREVAEIMAISTRSVWRLIAGPGKIGRLNSRNCCGISQAGSQGSSQKNSEGSADLLVTGCQTPFSSLIASPQFESVRAFSISSKSSFAASAFRAASTESGTISKK